MSKKGENEMKRIFSMLIATICCTIAFLGVFTSCGYLQQESQNPSNTTNNQRIVGSTDLPDSVNRCVATKAKRVEYNSYKKDGLYYYIFNVGTLEAVPLQDEIDANYIYRYDGSTEATLTLSTAESTFEQISTVVEKVNEKSGGWSIGGKLEASLQKAIKLTLESSYKEQWIETITNTSKKTSEFASAESKSMEFTWRPEVSKPGYYRYVLEGTLEVFACIVYDPIEKTEVYSTSYSLIKESHWALEYSESSNFDTNELNQFDLPEGYLDVICQEPEIDYSDFNDTYVVETKNILNNTNTVTIEKYQVQTVVTHSSYGLNQANYDELDLSSYKEYFTDDNIFCFEITVNISEKNDGWQELFLYNQIDKGTSKTVNYVTAQTDYGMICGSRIDHKDGESATDHTAYWYVNGNKLKEKMYIRYDAQFNSSSSDALGNKKSIWYRRGISVNLTVAKASVDIENNDKIVFNNDKQFTIYDTGYYGLHPKQSYDEIALDEYTKYMDSEYLFVFDFSVKLKEKDDGYQEIYLYNENNTSSKTISTPKAIEYGLVAGTVIEHVRGKKSTESKTYAFTFCVNGTEINNSMFVRYDAFGSDSDTWYRENITVKLRIFKVPQFSLDETVYNSYETY